jgi:hypothetical protein
MSLPNPNEQMEYFILHLEEHTPKRVGPVFVEGSMFDILKKLEISRTGRNPNSWLAQYHHWKYMYGKAPVNKKKQLLQLHHKFLSGLKDIETDEGVVLTEEEVAAYMGVEMPQ